MTVAEAHASADLQIMADTDHDQGPLDLPVVPPDRLPEFRREWLRRPLLRALIHAARRAGEQRCRRSKAARALWELSQSEEWARDALPGGAIRPFPFFSDFDALMRTPETEAAMERIEREPHLAGRALVARRLRAAQGRALDRRRHQEAMSAKRDADDRERETRRAIRVGDLGGAWRLRMMTMFSMSDTTGRLKTAEELEAAGYVLDGNIYRAPEHPQPAPGRPAHPPLGAAAHGQ